ncbi:MAG TPA: pilus assembly protein PilM [Caldisericia bacterium]|nr:pilus assembly protein PilM [Caldisericia bacterium]HOU08069.1 pilus assembly protein PilM [Caldisericia bacterium]HPL89058.1 pilus assembly protein PilM [Caldisericia bacterium]HQG59685.1 pilus assembly protein PilM [Caldisericia bacterium]HQH49025.1 pilus assembly protein PilM [Caldisericia bacterium]
MKIGPIGIHLGDQRIKIAQVASDKDRIQIIEMVSLPTPEGSIIQGFVKAPRVAADAIMRAISESKFNGRKAVIAHPTEILKVHTMTVQDSAELDKAISTKLSQMSFEQPEELIFDYKIAARENGRVKAIVAITNKKHVQKIQELATQSKLTLGGTDLEMLSTYRVVAGTYRTPDTPTVIAMLSDQNVKLALFCERVLSYVKTTDLQSSQAKSDPKQLSSEIGKFLGEYRKTNLLTGEPVIFLAGLPEPSFEMEKAVWEELDSRTTSVRWSEAFSLSPTYNNFGELTTRFGAFCCAIGLSLSDMQLPQSFKSPIIPDVRQPGYTPDLLKFEG